jgi:hypothetical protein
MALTGAAGAAGAAGACFSAAISAFALATGSLTAESAVSPRAFACDHHNFHVVLRRRFYQRTVHGFVDFDI